MIRYYKTYQLFFVLGILLLTRGLSAQDCPLLSLPLNGDMDVEITSSINWNNVPGVTAYIISLGTTPGGSDILNRQNVGSATTFNPPLGLPDNTQVYVTISLFILGNITDITCTSETFRTVNVTVPPDCTTFRSPLDGATGINVGTDINWNYATFATGYSISMGTSPNGTDIVNNVDVLNNLTYNPMSDLPPNTRIFVLVTPYNENNPDPICSEISFTTAELAPLPTCTSLTSPTNGAINIPLTPLIEWNAVPEATGYRLSIGNSPFNMNILDNANFATNATLVIDFEPNRTFFVTIVPFNATGEAIGCTQESFSTITGCGPFFDGVTGELTVLNPEINIPDEIEICLNTASATYTSIDIAEGYRWYNINKGILLTRTPEVTFSESGQYRYEAFNIFSQDGIVIECPTVKTFNVLASEAPTIDRIRVTETAVGLTLEAQVTGVGLYEYALDDINGTYQDSNIFTEVAPGDHTIYVRDKNGCGITEKTIQQELTLDGFPKFFTPNGDGINDVWQYMPILDRGEINVRTIFIFNRFGALMAQIDPNSTGWNGLQNGRPAPASDYWFTAISTDNKNINGHFSLKR